MIPAKEAVTLLTPRAVRAGTSGTSIGAGGWVGLYSYYYIYLHAQCRPGK